MRRVFPTWKMWRSRCGRLAEIWIRENESMYTVQYIYTVYTVYENKNAWFDVPPPVSNKKPFDLKVLKQWAASARFKSVRFNETIVKYQFTWQDRLQIVLQYSELSYSTFFYLFIYVRLWLRIYMRRVDA